MEPGSDHKDNYFFNPSGVGYNSAAGPGNPAGAGYSGVSGSGNPAGAGYSGVSGSGNPAGAGYRGAPGAAYGGGYHNPSGAGYHGAAGADFLDYHTRRRKEMGGVFKNRRHNPRTGYVDLRLKPRQDAAVKKEPRASGSCFILKHGRRTVDSEKAPFGASCARKCRFLKANSTKCCTDNPWFRQAACGLRLCLPKNLRFKNCEAPAKQTIFRENKA